MSDPLEEADKITAMMLEDSLRKRHKVPEKTGFCLDCDEPTEGAFCCQSCRENYERRQRIESIKGKK